MENAGGNVRVALYTKYRSGDRAAQQVHWALHAETRATLEMKAFEANVEHEHAERVALETRQRAEQESAVAARSQAETEHYNAETKRCKTEAEALQEEAHTARYYKISVKEELHATQKSMWDERSVLAELEQQQRRIESEAEQCIDREEQFHRLIVEKTECVADLKLKMRNFTGSDQAADEQTLAELTKEVQQQRVLKKLSQGRCSVVEAEAVSCREMRAALTAEQDVEDEALQSFLTNALL